MALPQKLRVVTVSGAAVLALALSCGGEAGGDDVGIAGAAGTLGSGGSGGGAAGNGGAAPNTVMWAADYDQSCERDAQCVVVTEGNACVCEVCQNAAVSESAAQSWDLDSRNIVCPPREPGQTCTATCTEVLPACAESKCTVRPPVYIDPAEFDRSCADDGDCHLVFTGEACSPCRCGTAAVSLPAYEQYLQRIASVVCTPGPPPCDCEPPTSVRCEKATPEDAFGSCTTSF